MNPVIISSTHSSIPPYPALLPLCLYCFYRIAKLAAAAYIENENHLLILQLFHFYQNPKYCFYQLRRCLKICNQCCQDIKQLAVPSSVLNLYWLHVPNASAPKQYCQDNIERINDKHHPYKPYHLDHSSSGTLEKSESEGDIAHDKFPAHLQMQLKKEIRKTNECTIFTGKIR